MFVPFRAGKEPMIPLDAFVMLSCFTFWRIAWLVLFGIGSRKLLLSNTTMPKHGKEGSETGKEGSGEGSGRKEGREGTEEGRRRSPSPQGDESDEGDEGVKVETIGSVAMLPPG